jgi:hypothetical protein
MNLLLAAVLLMQDMTAEETFKKIERAVGDAKTLTVKVTGKVSSPTEGIAALPATISLLLKNDRMVHFDVTVGSGDDVRSSSIISDGSSLRVRFGARRDYDKETPDAMRSLWNLALVRTGLLIGGFFFQDVVRGGKPIDLKEILQVSDLKMGDDDGPAKTLTFTVKLDRTDDAQVRFWYDPKSFALQKRSVLATKNGAVPRGTFSEAYDEFILNADIPDEKFKLPEEKK